MAIRTLIIDDEPVARARVRRLLRVEQEFEIIGECGDGRAALEAIRRDAPDLVFLDVQMPELDGLQVLTALEPDELPTVVFVTAYDEYALNAFDVSAVDYLVKPFSPERFRQTVQRVLNRLSASVDRDRDRVLALLAQLQSGQRALTHALRPNADRGYLERLLVKTRGRTFLVRVADVDYIESAANYVRVHSGKDVHLVRERIGVLAERLDPARFARVHRTTIVNLDRIRELQPWFSGDAVAILTSGQKLRVSRAHREALEQALMPRG